jgi:four helix bundle protein
MKFEHFEEIDAWRVGRELTRQVYEAAKRGNFGRDIGLKNQIQRDAAAVMHHVAEGFDSGSAVEFVKLLRFSRRSCAQVQSELYVALDQGYIDEEQFQRLYDLADQARDKVVTLSDRLADAEPRAGRGDL